MDESVNQLLKLQDVLLEYVNSFLAIVPAIGIAIVVFVVFLVLASLAKRTVSGFSSRFTEDKSLQSLFGTITKVLVIVVGAFAAAAIIFPGLSAGHLVSVLGLSSVAIGFAFKDIFENFLAGILILSGRPFVIGDQIETNGYEGTVEHISIRSTSIETYDGQRVIIPNSAIFTNPMTVRTAFPHRRTTFVTGIGYDEDIETAREVIREAVNGCETVLEDPAPQIFLMEHGDSSVNFHIRYWTPSTISGVKNAQDEVATSVKYALDEAGIEIPYPYRTIEFFDKTEQSEQARAAE
ncbi:mechanosensitive ion channel family protein [Persicimonas caeni]|uniref:Mechanosensitive ion channel family protein n=1 Tax=Persicimonas caeni TaxID=2292766 RepID=A0A4Y6Q159_PERCE|nr:mechanosensitive ion channel family protein [Persicimonas caeni]QDG54316.1 mechanosensitive ion channel family protein [Persicimonas caeni]QED35537.1 mechanosensitive ion channel family protein [Persicimonas caeni]